MFSLQSNLGLADRMLRFYTVVFLVGAVLLGAVPPWLALVAVVVFATLLTAWDPIYAVMDWRTNRRIVTSQSFVGPNIASKDRAVRYVTSIAMLVTGLTMAVYLKFTFLIAMLLILPVYLFVTAVTAWDPVYALVIHWGRYDRKATVVPFSPKPGVPPTHGSGNGMRKVA